MSCSSHAKSLLVRHQSWVAAKKVDLLNCSRGYMVYLSHSAIETILALTLSTITLSSLILSFTADNTIKRRTLKRSQRDTHSETTTNIERMEKTTKDRNHSDGKKDEWKVANNGVPLVVETGTSLRSMYEESLSPPDQTAGQSVSTPAARPSTFSWPPLGFPATPSTHRPRSIHSYLAPGAKKR